MLSGEAEGIQNMLPPLSHLLFGRHPLQRPWQTREKASLLLTAREAGAGGGARGGAREAGVHPPRDLPDDVQLGHPPPEPPPRLATLGPFELRMTSDAKS